VIVVVAVVLMNNKSEKELGCSISKSKSDPTASRVFARLCVVPRHTLQTIYKQQTGKIETNKRQNSNSLSWIIISSCSLNVYPSCLVSRT
jgi:hypothetical protein